MAEPNGSVRSRSQETAVGESLPGDVAPRDASRESASATDRELSVPVRLLLSAITGSFRAGETEAAETALSELARHLDELTPEVVELIARAKGLIGNVADGATGLAYAAERWRLAGESGRAVDLCHLAQGAGAGVPGIHQTWGLALLAIGDAEGARGHLERWREEGEHELDALIWSIEALWSCGRVDDVKRAVRALAAELNIQAGETDAAVELRRRLEAHLERSGDPLASTRSEPFWRADIPMDLEGDDGCSEEQSPQDQTESPSSGEQKSTVLLVEDVDMRGAPLSETLQMVGFEVSTCGSGEDLVETERQPAHGPDVIVFPLQASDPAELDRIRKLRESEELRQVPILGVVESHGSAENRRSLRALGVVGILDTSTSPAQLAFRLNRIVRTAPVRRLYERAPAFFPVALEAGGRVTAEYALSISVGGMGVTSERLLDPNTDVRLRFSIEDGSDPLELAGRVVYCRCDADCAPINEVGLFFVGLDAEKRSRLEGEVARLLDR